MIAFVIKIDMWLPKGMQHGRQANVVKARTDSCFLLLFLVHSSLGSPDSCVCMLGMVAPMDVRAHMPILKKDGTNVRQVHEVHKIGDGVGHVREVQKLPEAILSQEQHEEEGRLQHRWRQS